MKQFGIQFILCIFLSASVWLLHNLSLYYTETVSVQVAVQSNIEGRAQSASHEVCISARCKAKGFRLINLNSRKKAVRLFVDQTQLVSKGEDVYILPASHVYNYCTEIFGEETSVEALITDDLQLCFPIVNSRRVPVLAVQEIGYKSQYCALKPISFSPDSVTIYGDASIIDRITAVHTKQINYPDLSRSVHGNIKLEKIPGVRISAEEASYSIEVGRFVELSSMVRVRARNVPSGTDMAIIPDMVKVTMRCSFPVIGDPFENALFWVDWCEFSSSHTGNCIIHWSNLPDQVISCQTDPSVCECFEKQR